MIRALAALAVGVAGVVVPAGPATADSGCAGADRPRIVSLVGAGQHTEGTRGPGPTAFPFVLTSTGCARDGTVTVTMVGPMAQASDFQAITSTATFSAGSGLTAKTVTFAVLPDSVPEQNERFAVMITATTGRMQIGQCVAEGTILNDDGATLPGTIIPELHCSE